jgi:hypothetical protein
MEMIVPPPSLEAPAQHAYVAPARTAKHKRDERSGGGEQSSYTRRTEALTITWWKHNRNKQDFRPIKDGPKNENTKIIDRS